MGVLQFKVDELSQEAKGSSGGFYGGRGFVKGLESGLEALKYVVECRGIEPLTFALPARRSPS